MPRYDYLCASNGQVVEVTHALGQPLATWGEVCERLGIEPGATPASAPVERLMSAPNMVLGKASGGEPAAPAAAAPAHHCCGGGCHRH